MEIRPKLKNFIKTRWSNLCRRSHYFLMGLPFVLVTSGIVLSIASVVRIDQILDRQSFQYSAEYFESKSMPYRYLTVLGPGLRQEDGSAPRKTMSGLDIEAVKSIHETLDLTESASIGNGRGSKNTSIENVWEDCYSTTAKYSAVGILNDENTGSVDSCEIVGVGGAYGIVHPFLYESGGFLNAEGNDRFSIVLNTQLAWNLFHSYEVLGAFVDVNGIQYQVVGVVNDGKGALAETTGGTKPRAYVRFESMVNLANGSRIAVTSSDVEDQVKEEDLAVTCYEVILMDPIKNIAKNDLVSALSDNVGYSEDSSELLIINNTDRFNVLSLFKKYFPLKNSYTGGEGLDIPFYERSARLAEQYVVFWAEALVVGILCIIVGGGYIYAIFHGKETRHKREDESEDDHEISMFDNRLQ